jgi:hypothetical protein
MMKTKLFAAAAIASALIVSPVMARDMYHSRAAVQVQSDDAYAYDRSDSGFWPADAAAGIVGGAVGTAGAIAGGAVNTAGAIATAPFGGPYAYNNGYNGDYRMSQSYAQLNGFVCQPGTWFRGEDGRRHICQ